MAELVKNPKLMKKAQEEIRNYVGNKLKVAEDDIEQFPYLKMIVKETLKLHPLAPLLIPREIISHLKIEGYDFYQKNNSSSERLGNWTRPHILGKTQKSSFERDLKRAQLITKENTLSYCHSGLIGGFASG